MSLYTANLYTPDGRLRGSYVYMLLCQLEEPAIHIKVGRSCNPFARLEKLRSSCPVVPHLISVVELATRRKAVVIEREMHSALNRWHSRGEWFVVLPFEKAKFNAAWKVVFDRHSQPERRMVWNHFSVAELIAEARRLSQMRQRKFMMRGDAYQDYIKSGGTL